MSKFKKKEKELKKANYNLDTNDSRYQSTEVKVYTKFEDLLEPIADLAKRQKLLSSIFKYGFKEPSDIQSKIIRPIIEGRDVLGSAQSGTGKTGAFSIGIFGRIDENDNSVQALIISPTRELAQQTYTFMKELGKDMYRVALFVGGDSVEESSRLIQVERPQIVIATIGRLVHLLKEKLLSLSNLTVLCLDEADEIFKTVYEDGASTIKEVFPYIPQKKPKVQVILITATVSEETVSLTEGIVENPVKIIVTGEDLVLDGIDQYCIEMPPDSRWQFIQVLFSKICITKLVVFVNSKRTLEELSSKFEKSGSEFKALSIHSRMSNNERRSVMEKFRKGDYKILLSTDLLAKGIDVQQITLVVNYEIPEAQDIYLHRIGRSGRFGRGGIAVNIVSSEAERGRLLSYYEHYGIKLVTLELDQLVECISSKKV